MKAYKSLVKHCLANGHTVSVEDGGDWAVKRGTSYQVIIDAIESVDESQLRIRNSAGDIIGWALIVLGVDDDETVADYSGKFVDDWFEAQI